MALLLATVVPTWASTNGRCPPTSQAKADKAIGVVEVCNPIDAEIRKDPLEIPTQIITDVAKGIGVIPSEAVVWVPSDGHIKYAIPNKPEFADYSICRLTTRTISEIPGQGNYLRAGWLRPASPRVAYFKLFLKRRGGTQGKTSYHADAYFSYVPTAKLNEARSNKICMTEAELAAIPTNR
jgi:hypothetical protein